MKVRPDRHVRCSSIAKKWLVRSVVLASGPKARRAMEKAQYWTKRAMQLGQR